MTFVEIACALVLFSYGAFHIHDRPIFVDWIALSLAGLLGEETCIGVYRFYAYAPDWHLTLGYVPVFIALIWPPVVLSARGVARGLLGPRARSPWSVAAVTGALVTFDAALIEPIAVRSGLWSWSEPGIFGVPVIGIVGWGFFGFAATLWLEKNSGALRWLVVLVAPAITHALLLVSWWVLFRWILRAEIPAGVATIGVAMASAIFLSCVVVRRTSLAQHELVPRVLATLLFAVLLVRHASMSLVIYAVCFVPPHVALCVPSKSSRTKSP